MICRCRSARSMRPRPGGPPRLPRASRMAKPRPRPRRIRQTSPACFSSSRSIRSQCWPRQLHLPLEPPPLRMRHCRRPAAPVSQLPSSQAACLTTITIMVAGPRNPLPISSSARLPNSSRAAAPARIRVQPQAALSRPMSCKPCSAMGHSAVSNPPARSPPPRDAAVRRDDRLSLRRRCSAASPRSRHWKSRRRLSSSDLVVSG